MTAIHQLEMKGRQSVGRRLRLVKSHQHGRTQRHEIAGPFAE
jgi:hypothetical protein